MQYIRHLKIWNFCIHLVLFVFIISACTKPVYQYSKIAGQAQGTTYHITYENSTNTDYSRAIDSILKKFDNSLSIYNPNSIISRVNNNDPTVEVDDFFKAAFKKSREVFENSNGAFDITVGPLVNAWGFGTSRKLKMDKSKIDSLLQYVGMNKVKLVGNKVIKEKPGIKIDVNALAQGYSVDVVCGFFDKEGIKNYIVEIGGEVRCKGINPKQESWRIGIDKPVVDTGQGKREMQAIVMLKNKSISTSGNYRKFYIENGVKYVHHIDPHTGYPTKNNLLSVTIIADDCITTDSYATACLVFGLEGTRGFLKKHPEIDAYLIYSDDKGNFKCEFTPNVANMLAK